MGFRELTMIDVRKSCGGGRPARACSARVRRRPQDSEGRRDHFFPSGMSDTP